jgi:hypothetical protein
VPRPRSWADELFGAATHSGVPGTVQTVSGAANLYSVAAVAPACYAVVGMVASAMNTGDDIVTSS